MQVPADLTRLSPVAGDSPLSRKVTSMTKFSIGQPVSQVEAPRLLKGEGRYTDDVTLAHQAYAVFLRSPYGHADITRLDVRAAAQMPGVLAVLTGEDYAADGLGPVGGLSPTKRRDGRPLFRPARIGITRDRVRHVGQIVAMVIADSINEAKDAVEAIEIEYAPLPVHTSTAAANKPGTPPLWEGSPDNESMYVKMGEEAPVIEAFKKADHVVRDTFVVSRICANTLEPRSVNAHYDRGRDHYTIYACQQRPYVWRRVMCGQTLKIAESQMRLIAGDVGGSFGMKGGLYAEVPLAAWASKKVGRPVKWTCERSEGHIADDQGRDMHAEAQLALDKQGNFLCYRISSNNNLGAFVPMLGNGATASMCESAPGAYKTPAVLAEAVGVLTNTVHVANYRSPGRAPGTYILERIIDMAASDLGINPVEIRRRNLVPESMMPYTPMEDVSYDVGDYHAVMEKCLKLADYDNRDKRKAEAKSRGKLRGVGVVTIVDPSAGPQPEMAELRFDPGGTVTVLVGTTAGGQSHATVYTQIVSDKLGLDAETIRVVEGDTDTLSWGTGTGSARVATIGGTAVFKAVEKTIAKARRIAAHLLEAAVADIEFADGVFTVAGTDRKIPFTEVAKVAFQPNKLGPDIEIGLYENATWQPEVSNVPYATQVCEVEVDPETGKIDLVRYAEVHDVGVELNPNLVAGQIHGGIAQAAGQALMEQVIYDPEGQVLTGSFMDYAMPRASDLCNFDLDSMCIPTKTNPLGVKGVGECGTVGGIGCVMNAVNDALAPLGVRNLSMPTTPEKVWRAIQEARARA
jgi:carbon-monoxide dehydrogenase large subunit